MTASTFSNDGAGARPIMAAKLLDGFTHRTQTTTTNNQQYTDSFNTTQSTSDVQGDTGNTTLTIGDSSAPNSWLDKILPAVVLGALVIAGLFVLRSK
jgi:hypothetical protein